MASLSIDLGAPSAPVSRVAPPPSAKSEFGRIIGGIASPDAASADQPRKIELPLAKARARRPKGIIGVMIARQAAAPLPVDRQKAAAVDAGKAETKEEKKPEPDAQPQWLADVAPPPAPTTTVAALPLQSPIPADTAPTAPDAGLEEAEQIVAIMTSAARPVPGPAASPSPSAQPLVALPLAEPLAQEATTPVPVHTSDIPTPIVLAPALGSRVEAPVPVIAGDAERVDLASLANPVSADKPTPPIVPLPPAQAAPAPVAAAAAAQVAAPQADAPVDQPTAFAEIPAEPDVRPRVRPAFLSPSAASTVQPQPVADAALMMAAATAARVAREDGRPAPAAFVEPLAGVAGVPGLAPAPTTGISPTVAPAAVAAPTLPLDTGRGDWIESMIDRIDDLRGNAGVRSTHIRLLPDALGQVDVSIRQEGDQVHVNFTVDTAAARTLIADAAPRLAELADARGLKLGGTGVETGAGGERRANQPDPEINSTPMRADDEAELASSTSDDRIA